VETTNATISVNSWRVTVRRDGSDVEMSILTPGGTVITTV
jgi:hypothetical protein